MNYFTRSSRSILLMLLVMLGAATYSQAQDLVVAQDGSGNYRTVQAAIDAAPTNRTTPFVIYIKNGRYKEKINIPSNKPFLQLKGENVAKVILTFDDYSGKAMPGGGTFGTANSASVTVNANDFTAIDITFENTTGESPQALAINVNGDRAAFKNCRFLGGQDTLLTNGAGKRQYYRNCYIDGTVDFIFGSAIAIFDSCVVYAKTRATAGNSYITAANTPNTQQYGYVFRDCEFPANRGGTVYFLGRPWQNSEGFAPVSWPKTVLINSILSSTIRPEGWSVWNAGTKTDSITYAEYKSKYYNGTLVDTTQRVSWSHQLTDAEAAAYTFGNVFGTWDPCTAAPGFCTATPEPIAISNFRGVKGASVSTFNWNISWPISQLQYELMRSSDRINFTPVAQVTAQTDTAVNFQLTDPIPPSGSIYYYFIRASKAGVGSQTSDTISISSAPTIHISGAPGAFYQVLGQPSPTQSYTVSGTDLTSDIVITPPANYEVSANNGTNWYTNSSPLTVTRTGATVPSTTILVRLNATTQGTYAGNIVHTSTNAETVTVAVTGTAVNAPTKSSTTLQYWPLTQNAQDSAAARAAGVQPSAPTLNRLYLSNGTTVAAIPAYSALRGQAFGASANGDGTWTTTSGGPGGTLNRNYYEQFTVSPATDYTIRLDSIILNSVFYNTSSNTNLAIVYSLSGFTNNDSTAITGGTGPTGGAVTGSFAAPIPLANQTSGNTNTYRLALNGTEGVTIPAGGTLSIRLYYSCGSGSPGRYALLKDVHVKGETFSSLPVTLVNFTAKQEGQNAQLSWSTKNEYDMHRYVVERSTNGTNYKTQGTVIASNNISSIYNFTDVMPATVASFYYRLKMVNKDGSFAYSPVARLILRKNGSLSVYPNPVANALTIVHAPVTEGQVEIYSLDGKKVLTAIAEKNSSQTTLDVSRLAKGTYVLRMFADGQTVQHEFLKL
ncbi:pectinesterase family protein [Aridibaculum aurantiacum]|uniref:pectinesterase family protein n=1 Tax=Aridibaculum aurantiacum TaxID=2810307 RepID=UPI001A96B9F6|nr:pectinesterase family protein [Aridibaculum aurantiacum]